MWKREKKNFSKLLKQEQQRWLSRLSFTANDICNLVENYMSPLYLQDKIASSSNTDNNSNDNNNGLTFVTAGPIAQLMHVVPSLDSNRKQNYYDDIQAGCTHVGTPDNVYSINPSIHTTSSLTGHGSDSIETTSNTPGRIPTPADARDLQNIREMIVVGSGNSVSGWSTTTARQERIILNLNHHNNGKNVQGYSSRTILGGGLLSIYLFVVLLMYYIMYHNKYERIRVDPELLVQPTLFENFIWPVL